MSKFTKLTPFPEPNKPLYLILLVNSYNLVSSTFDGMHLSTLFNDKLNATHIYILCDNVNSEKKMMANLTKYNNITVIHCDKNIDVLNNLTNLITKLENCDLCITISSHGYAQQDHNYIIFNNTKINDYEFNKSIVADMKPTVNCLILIDACQSGTEINLNYQTCDIELKKYTPENKSDNINNVVSISAVTDSQYSEDDISDLGFDGALCSAFIDYYYEHIDKMPCIGGFYQYYSKRLANAKKQSILSFNNIHFLG
jgi:hypothetical protein